MSEIYDVIGTSSYEPLLSDPAGGDVIAVAMMPGNGTVKRGALIYRTANGMYAPAGTSQITASYNLLVLAEDVDTNANAAVAEDAAAYRAGRFIDGRVTYDNSGTPTAVTEAHKVVLRGMGIVLDKADDAAGYENGSVKITYKANNGVTPAEADVVKTAVSGTTYTILNNSDSDLSFTAPATKSFSKWNTAADGSGTDYAAAASYSATANLTLFAIWA